jgi:hypothetical protein
MSGVQKIVMSRTKRGNRSIGVDWWGMRGIMRTARNTYKGPGKQNKKNKRFLSKSIRSQIREWIECFLWKKES